MEGYGLEQLWINWEVKVGSILKERGCLILILCVRDH